MLFLFSTQANAADSPSLLLDPLRSSVLGTAETKSDSFSNRISSTGLALVIAYCRSGLPPVPAAADTSVSASALNAALTATWPALT